jgi:hypothetical protein
MKKIILATAVVLLLSGCASSFQQASTDCQKAGFKPGSDMYLGCINNQTKRTAFEQYMINRASAPQVSYQYESYGPKTTTCHQSGSYITCSRF